MLQATSAQRFFPWSKLTTTGIENRINISKESSSTAHSWPYLMLEVRKKTVGKTMTFTYS